MINLKYHTDKLILEHYKKVAKNHGLNPDSTMRDQYIRQSETEFFLREIENFYNKKDTFNILDLGCGNGHLLSIFRDHFPKANLFGLEFTPELYGIAKNRGLKNCLFTHGDARDENSFLPQSMDIIITERVIINILNRRQQYKVLGNIKSWLKPNGRYLLSESFRDPLLNLNQARKEFNLNEIEPSEHNLFPYLESFEKYCDKIGLKKADQLTNEHFLSTHFYLTRVIHLMSKPLGAKAWDTEFLNFFHKVMPTAIGNYSPILFKSYSISQDSI